jgi:hypothetical protein
MDAPHFGPAGQQFWDAVTAAYDLRPDEQMVLAQICAELDVLDVLQTRFQQIVQTGAVPPGALLTALSQHRNALAVLHKRLSLPDVEDKTNAGKRSAAARAAAVARWRVG